MNKHAARRILVGRARKRMPHYGGGGGWLPLLCWCFFLDALARPRQPQVVYVQQVPAAGAAGGELPLVACATIQRDSTSVEKV